MQTLIIAISFIMIAGFCLNSCITQKKLLSPTEVIDKIFRGAIVIDVRTPNEFSRGHIESAKNHPVQYIADRVDSLPKDKDIILYCLSGHRSAHALKILKKNGFIRVYNAGSYARIEKILSKQE